MTELLHELIDRAAQRTPGALALTERDRGLSYEALAETVARVSGGLMAAGLERGERVAIYLPKQLEAVIGFFAACKAGGAFVPVNPQLKAAQVGHILNDCGVKVLITSPERAGGLAEVLARCPRLQTLVLTGDAALSSPGPTVLRWQQLLDSAPAGRRVIDMDLAAVLYTSGSTGKPKGVMLSHRNMVCGAVSVAQYLGNTAGDRLLTVLPFSFDYGFSQLSTAFHSGATAVLFDYLMPRDVVRKVARERITGLAGVPPLWIQLARLEWPDEATGTLRYITNSGGAMPSVTLEALRAKLPATRVFLMYGLTEAFRSTYLDPDQIDLRPGSIGKAIPNAEIIVARPDGTQCDPGEPGELVHRGSLVALGYWNDQKRTAERFRPVPVAREGATIPELAVWSGDTVRTDEDGYLYFVGRRDEMIKTSGYRVSPAEVEEILYAHPDVQEVVAVGAAHPELGQAIVVVAAVDGALDQETLTAYCRRELPAFMVPARFVLRDSLPRNPNGKIDRATIASECADCFKELFA